MLMILHVGLRVSEQDLQTTSLSNNNGKYLNIPNGDHGRRDHRRSSSSYSGKCSTSMTMKVPTSI